MKGAVLAVVAVENGGKGTRGKRTPCLQPLLGKSCLELVVASLADLNPKKIYLATNLKKDLLGGHEGFSDKDTVAARGWPRDLNLLFSLGSGWTSNGERNLVIVDARFPLLQGKTLKSLFRRHVEKKNSVTVLEAGIEVTRPKTPSPAVAAIFLRGKDVAEVLRDKPGKKRSRLVLATLLNRLRREGKNVEMVKLSPDESLPVDSPARAALAIRILRLRKIRQLEARGVVVLDPLSTWVDLDVRVGRDTVIYPSVVLEGNSRIGRECRVYPFVHLLNTQVGNRVKILSSTMLEGSRVGHEAQVGPFTHFRPQTVVRSRAKVGNFVEMKNTVFGPESKAGHLSYLGDCIVERGVNIGAGTITCNYDGLKKSRTIIQRGAFIGSGTELVAPVKIGRNAYIGAGSTITKNVSPNALAVARSRQTEKPGWAKRRRMRKQE